MAQEPIRKISLADGSTRYRVVVNAGRRPDGSRSQRTSTHRTRKEARAWLTSIRSSLTDGTYVPSTQTRLSEHLDQWLEGKRDIRPSTRRGYLDALKAVRAMLGDTPVQ